MAPSPEDPREHAREQPREPALGGGRVHGGTPASPMGAAPPLAAGRRSRMQHRQVVPAWDGQGQVLERLSRRRHLPKEAGVRRKKVSE